MDKREVVTYTIYGWQFPDGIIKYVGKTKNPHKRRLRYLRKANPRYKKNTLRAVHVALRAEWTNINRCKFVVLADNLSSDEAKIQEAKFIAEYDSYRNGLNKTYWG